MRMRSWRHLSNRSRYADMYLDGGFDSLAFVEYYFGALEVFDRRPVPEDAVTTADEVLQSFFSLVFFWYVFRQLFDVVDARELLGDQAVRHFVVGHPDAVGGILAGRVTLDGWEVYDDSTW